MKKETINKVFSEYMGFAKVKIGYETTSGETIWQIKNKDWLEGMGIENVGTYAANVKDNIIHIWEELKYTESWDWFMPVWEKASNNFDHSDYLVIRLKGKIIMNISDVNIERACNYLYDLIKFYNNAKDC